jgi:hypothetical protein
LPILTAENLYSHNGTHMTVNFDGGLIHIAKLHSSSNVRHIHLLLNAPVGQDVPLQMAKWQQRIHAISPDCFHLINKIIVFRIHGVWKFCVKLKLMKFGWYNN